MKPLHSIKKGKFATQYSSLASIPVINWGAWQIDNSISIDSGTRQVIGTFREFNVQLESTMTNVSFFQDWLNRNPVTPITVTGITSGL
jgi:hypothetical protein